MSHSATEFDAEIPVGKSARGIQASVVVPAGSRALIVLVRGGSATQEDAPSRYIAAYLNISSLATLVVNLLTQPEDDVDRRTAGLRSNASLLAERLVDAIDWTAAQTPLAGLPIGLFSSGAGAAAALAAATQRRERVYSIVVRACRIELAGNLIERVSAPTLFVVGADEATSLQRHRRATARMTCATRIDVVPDASERSVEPSALDNVASLARAWFQDHISGLTAG